jgi:hypothetical protein
MRRPLISSGRMIRWRPLQLQIARTTVYHVSFGLSKELRQFLQCVRLLYARSSRVAGFNVWIVHITCLWLVQFERLSSCFWWPRLWMLLSIAEFCLLQKFYLLSKVWILTFECMMRIITKRTMLYFDDDLVTCNWVMRYIGQSCNAEGLWNIVVMTFSNRYKKCYSFQRLLEF